MRKIGLEMMFLEFLARIVKDREYTDAFQVNFMEEAPEDFVLCLVDFYKSDKGPKYWWYIHKLWIEELKDAGVEVPENYG